MYESYINKIEDVGKLRNLKPKTITLYQKNVSRFLNYIKKNPEELTCEDARNYLLHLQGKGDKASTLNNNNGSLVFFYKRVLGKLWDDNLVPRAINDYAVPEVLSFHDVEKLLNATEDLKYKAIFAIMYSSGLRISEVLHLHYEDISRKNMQIYIRDSKTHTARYALLSKRALDILTEYWFTCGRPTGILFPNRWTGEYLTTSGPRLVFKKSLKIAGLPHSIRMHSPLPQQAKVAHCIINCKTGAYGANVQFCEDCGHPQIHYNSCRNRCCPMCQALPKEKWMDKRREDVLEVPYFHVVFTVPQELNSLIYSNQQLLYDALYHSVSATINELTADTKHLGARVGYICVLHTWGSEMNYHPHIHVVLLGGGLTAKNQWRDKGEEFFLPVKILSKLFRGKYMDELKRLWNGKKLQFHGSSEKYRNHYAFKELLNTCYEKEWIPHCKKTFNGAQSVINYLGKYTHRIAISNHRIIHMDENTVTYYVKDYREEGKWKEYTISGIEFIRRFLMHVPPKRYVRIRHYGLLCTRSKTQHLTLCRNLLGCKQYLSKLKDMEALQMLETLYGINVTVCKCCGGHLGKPQQRIPLRI